MSERGKDRPGKLSKDDGRPAQAPVPLPVDVIDGVPDRSAGSRRWRLALAAVIFAVWMAFLTYAYVAGRQ